jgi:hypothetical protein
MTERDGDKADPRGGIAREEGDLAAFFEAARALEPTPSQAFVNAVLADAAGVAADRAPLPQPDRQPWPRAWQERWLRPIGGWIGAAALAGCAAVGFVAGTLGTGADLAAVVLAPEAGGLDLASESVTLFFDLDATEG